MAVVLVVGPRPDLTERVRGREGEERGSGRRPATQPRTKERSKIVSEEGKPLNMNLNGRA
jgi:hypothetical protein